MAASKKPTAVDKTIGDALKLRRQELGLTQTELARGIGVTFQQIQKYENGGSRIAASRLSEVAEYLHVPVAYFFQGVNGADHPRTDRLDVPEAMALLERYSRIEDPALRNIVLKLVGWLAGQEENPEATPRSPL